MTKDRFRELLEKVTQQVVEFTRTQVWNSIPDRVQYRVFANQSYDKRPDGRILTDFPEDSLPDSGFRMFSGPELAVSFLWRDGRVPQWINVQIEEATDAITTVDLVCCGRYTDNEEHMYYTPWGTGPFGVKGPSLPPGWRDGPQERFDLYWFQNLPKDGG